MSNLLTDERQCGDCKHFRDMGHASIPICTKKHMGVTRTMHVSYYEKDGTCWEGSETVKALNVKVGDVIQTDFHKNTPKARKYGFQAPATVTAVYEGRCQSGWMMNLLWPDGYRQEGLDVGWAVTPKAIRKVTESTDQSTGLKTTKVKTAKPNPQEPTQFEMFQ